MWAERSRSRLARGWGRPIGHAGAGWPSTHHQLPTAHASRASARAAAPRELAAGPVLLRCDGLPGLPGVCGAVRAPHVPRHRPPSPALPADMAQPQQPEYWEADASGQLALKPLPLPFPLCHTYVNHKYKVIFIIHPKR